MRKHAPLALLFAAACTEQVGQQCPPHTVSVGQYAINFAGQHPAGECTSDASVAATQPPVALSKPDGGTSFGSICFGAVDGGAQISLVIPNKGVRSSGLGDDGGFRFTAHTEPVAGTPCVCAVAIDEVFEGYLLASDAGAPFALQADGGVPQVVGLAGTVTDRLSTDAGNCYCALPCPVTYAITGTRQ